jgi:hypothetical protein
MRLRNRAVGSTLFVSLALFAACPLLAQVSAINSVRMLPRAGNDDATSVLTSVNNFPTLISFDDQSVDKNGATGGFANTHIWYFSANGGTNEYRFQNDDFFQVFMDVTLSANAATPRKEAGFRVTTTVAGEGLFIITTNQPNGGAPGEIAAFGGPLPFHKFNETYAMGTTIRLGMTYFKDVDGKRKIIYHAGNVSSPAKEFTNLEQGIIDQTRIGGYLQVNLDRTNPANFGTGEYENITIRAIRTVTGTVDLEDCADMAGSVVRFEFRPTTGSPFTQTAVLDAAGAFTLPAVPAGDYTVNVKGDRWLAKNVAVNATNGDVSGVNVGTLVGGDANDDNSVDVLDLDRLIQSFDMCDGDTGFIPGSDFNCDDCTDVLDLDILIRNFDRGGDS